MNTDTHGVVEARKQPKELVCQHCGKAFRGSARKRNGSTGRKYCSAECIALARRRRVEFRCKDCGRVELRVPSEAQHERCWACAMAYNAAKLREKPLVQRLDPLALAKWLEWQRSPERRERLREVMTGRAKATEKTRRGSARHCRALHCTVRTPAGVPHRVDNLSEFVRTHPDLFDPEDVVNRLRGRAGYQSRATRGLARLQSESDTRLSWKGWTVTFGCADELGRQAVRPEAIRVHENN